VKTTPIVCIIAGAVSLSACATKNFVTEALAPLDIRTRQNEEQIARTRGDVQQVDARVNSLTGEVQRIDATAQEALDRAIAAGRLAEGKFLYSVVLSDDSVKFPPSSADLSPEAMSRLDELARALMEENRNVYLEIQGHTDATGSPEGNMRLGAERAETVRRYLSTRGVPLNRINTISYGQDAPAAPNNTASGRAQNRRVVIQVLS
jgi:peptidoglycan-associated lipoprotein